MKKHAIFAFASAFGLLWSRPGHACNQSSENVSLSDAALIASHQCIPIFVEYANWYRANLHIEADDWARHGLRGGPCVAGGVTDFAKHLNASWLIASMSPIPPAADPNLIPQRRPFHDHDDYGFIHDGNDTRWHDTYKHTIIEGYENTGLFSHHPKFLGIGSTDESSTYCGLYDTNEPFTFVPDCRGCPPPAPGSCGANPCIILGRLEKPTPQNFVSERAIAIIHEGWHAWGERNLDSDYKDSLIKGHELPGVPDTDKTTFCRNQFECDHFRPHPSNEFITRQLVNAGLTTTFNGTPVRRVTTFHSVYQVELEFACDLADYAPESVPYSVREAAALTAKTDASTVFAEGVPYFCGSTRPFWTKDPGAIPQGTIPACLDQVRTDCGRGTNGSCGPNSSCGPDGCCVGICPNHAQQCTGLGTAGFSCGIQCNPVSGCCVPPTQPLKVSASTTQGGPDICIQGEGFTPGATVAVQYLGVPRSIDATFGDTATVDPDGKFLLKDKTQENNVVGCPPDQAIPDVEVQVVELGSSRNNSGTLPGDIWCGNAGVRNVRGGCRP